MLINQESKILGGSSIVDCYVYTLGLLQNLFTFFYDLILTHFMHKEGIPESGFFHIQNIVTEEKMAVFFFFFEKEGHD